MPIFLRPFIDSIRDLLPIILVIGFFQLVVLQQPIPNMGKLLFGTFMVVLGLTLFVRGLEMGLFPIGESMAFDFARKGSVFWVLTFAFALGFGTTVAEPALIAVAAEAAKVAQWMAANKKQFGGCCLICYAGMAVRVCQAAIENGLDIQGVHFFASGEPITEAKRQQIEVGSIPRRSGCPVTATGSVCCHTTERSRLSGGGRRSAMPSNAPKKSVGHRMRQRGSVSRSWGCPATCRPARPTC